MLNKFRHRETHLRRRLPDMREKTQLATSTRTNTNTYRSNLNCFVHVVQVTVVISQQQQSSGCERRRWG